VTRIVGLVIMPLEVAMSLARGNRCDWDEDTCAAAAQNGHLSCLQ